jgi:hypothetical protein
METKVSICNYLLTKTPLRLRGGASDDSDSGYEADSEKNYDDEPGSESNDDRGNEPDSDSGSIYARSMKELLILVIIMRAMEMIILISIHRWVGFMGDRARRRGIHGVI